MNHYRYFQWKHESTGGIAAHPNPRDSTFPQAGTFHHALARHSEPTERFLGERFATENTGNTSLPATHQIQRMDAQHRGEPTQGQCCTIEPNRTNPCGNALFSFYSFSWSHYCTVLGRDFVSVGRHSLCPSTLNYVDDLCNSHESTPNTTSRLGLVEVPSGRSVWRRQILR